MFARVDESVYGAYGLVAGESEYRRGFVKWHNQVGTTSLTIWASQFSQNHDFVWPAGTAGVNAALIHVGNGTLSWGTAVYVSSGSFATVIADQVWIGVGTLTGSAALDVCSNHSSQPIAVFRQANASNVAFIVVNSSTDNNNRPSYVRLERGGSVKWAFGLGYGDTTDSFCVSTTNLGAGITGVKFSVNTAGVTHVPNNVGGYSSYSTGGVGKNLIRLDGSNHIQIGQPDTIGNLYHDITGNNIWRVGGSEKMRFTSVGYLGIGATSHDEILHVKNSTTGTNLAHFQDIDYNYGLYISQVTGTPKIVFRPHTGQSAHIIFQTSAGAAAWEIATNAYVGTGLEINTGSTTRMYIEPTNGYVGINNTNPGAYLHVKGATDGHIRITRATSSTADFSIGVSSGELRIYDHEDAAYRMVINTSGNVGIGTTSPGSYKLNVVGTALATAGMVVSGAQPGGFGASRGVMDFSGGHTRFFSYGADVSTKGAFLFLQKSSDESQGSNPIEITTSGNILLAQTVGNVGIGTTSPSAKFHVISKTEQLRLGYDASYYSSFTVSSAGNLTITPSGGNVALVSTLTLPNSNTLTGGTNAVSFSAGATFANTISSAVYTSETTGWGISSAGKADFRYLYIDELHAKYFITDLEQSLAGGQIISKSVASVASNFTLPAAGGSGSLVVEEMQGFTGQVFTDGDLIRLRQTTRTANNSLTIADAWGTVVYVSRDTSTMPTTQTYTFTRSSGGLAGNASGTISAGTLALDYGTTGNGYVETTAVDGSYSPYQQVVTWTTHPLTTTTTKTRMGKLTGISDADFGGALTGFGFYVEQGYFKGNIVVKSGVSQALSAATIQIGNITGAAASGIKISNTGTASTSGIFGYTSGSAESFALRLDGTANVAGAYFNSTSIWMGNSDIANAATKMVMTNLAAAGTAAIKLGTTANSITSTANTGFYVDGDAYFRVGTATSGTDFIYFNTSTLQIKSTSFTLTGSTTLYIDTSKVALGTSASAQTTSDTNVGVVVSNDGTFKVYYDANNYFRMTGSTMRINATAFSLTTSNLLLSSSGYISFGATPPTTYGNNVGVWLGYSTYGKVSIYADASNYFQWDGTKLLIRAANFTLDSSGNLTASSATVSGAIKASSGSIGSFTIGTYLYTGSKTAWNDTNEGVHIGSDGIGIGNNVFTVNGSTGALVATSATITGTLTTAGTGSARVLVGAGSSGWTEWYNTLGRRGSVYGEAGASGYLVMIGEYGVKLAGAGSNKIGRASCRERV